MFLKIKPANARGQAAHQIINYNPGKKSVLSQWHNRCRIFVNQSILS
jgi:hypothetical protein